MKLDTREIKKLMAAYGWTIKALAERVGMKPTQMGLTLQRGTCSIPTAGKIAQALEVEIETIWKEGE